MLGYAIVKMKQVGLVGMARRAFRAHCDAAASLSILYIRPARACRRWYEKTMEPVRGRWSRWA
jgi:hypothetical protein